MKVAVSAGHHPGDPGECLAENVCEYGEVMPMLAEVVRNLESRGITAYLIGTGYLQDKVEDMQAIQPDCGVEIHLNGAAVDAQGCETLHYPGSEEGEALAGSIQALLPEATKNSDRGVKPGYYYDENGEKAGVLYFLQESSCPAVIVEPWFMAHEPEYLQKNWVKEKVGIAIAEGIARWGKQL